LRVEPRWLSVEEIIEANRAEVAETSEPFYLRDRGLLESACERPRSLWYYAQEDDVVRLAVSLLSGIASNHAFEQGNKRTALTWAMEDLEDIAYWVLNLIEHRISEEELADLMREYVVEP
jgi:death on curing protein